MRLIAVLLSVIAFACIGVSLVAQPIGLIVGASPVIGGSSGDCLKVPSASGAPLVSGTCSPASVSSFSGGTTGLTPNTPTTGAVVVAGTLGVANGGTNGTTAKAALSSLSAEYIACNSGADLSTASTTEVSLAACDFAGGLMGSNGTIEVEVFLDTKSTTQNGVYTLRIAAGSGTGTGGTAVANSTVTANQTIVGKSIIRNSNNASAQIFNQVITPYAATSSAFSTGAINTANAWTVRLNANIPTGNGSTDVFHIRGYTVRLIQTAGN